MGARLYVVFVFVCAISALFFDLRSWHAQPSLQFAVYLAIALVVFPRIVDSLTATNASL